MHFITFILVMKSQTVRKNRLKTVLKAVQVGGLTFPLLKFLEKIAISHAMRMLVISRTFDDILHMASDGRALSTT